MEWSVFILDIVNIILLLPVGLLSISFHEYMHGKVSNMLGDPTPKVLGRLTLNPLAHLDLIGTIALVLFRIGWAKPVPINPRYYKNPRKGIMYVGLAGPAANILLAIIFALFFHLFAMILNLSSIELYYFLVIGRLNSSILIIITTILFLGININLSLAIFNLIPFPPLDGSKILMGFLPPRFDKYFRKLEGPLGMVLLLLLFYTGIIGKIIFPIVNFLLDILI